MVAIRNCRVEAVEWLLAIGANANADYGGDVGVGSRRRPPSPVSPSVRVHPRMIPVGVEWPDVTSRETQRPAFRRPNKESASIHG